MTETTQVPFWTGPRLRLLPILLVLALGWGALQLAFLGEHHVVHD